MSLDRLLHLVRWLATIPVAVFGWLLGVLVTLLILQAHEKLCPAEYLVSGMCYAPWSYFVERMAMAIGSILCGALVVAFATWMAPRWRRPVALVSYLAGLAVASYFLLATGDAWPVGWAAAAGGLTLALFYRRYPQ